ncbi:MAG: exosortase system-associated protein, TIGR04073 family [Lentisphaeria bacterium]|nr:exosortase system-associated protein, TIGR04073 family [Lentisphaeria bacterium]NQZ68853.1 exosortase system-associated protein, TIGR04073 family [Lentisphaeria bacterium]
MSYITTILSKKNLFILICAFALSACQSYADEPMDDLFTLEPWAPAASMNHTPTRKLGRGISNFFFGMLEIPKAMISVNKEHGGFAGITWGTLLGAKRFVIREVVGVYEIFTFWYRHGTIIEPEFPFMPEEVIGWRVQHPQPAPVIPKIMEEEPEGEEDEEIKEEAEEEVKEEEKTKKKSWWKLW